MQRLLKAVALGVQRHTCLVELIIAIAAFAFHFQPIFFPVSVMRRLWLLGVILAGWGLMGLAWRGLATFFWVSAL